MDKDTTFKEHFFFELQRRDSLNNSLSLSVGIVTLLLGGAITMSKGVSGDGSTANAVLVLALVGTGVSLAATVYCLVRSIFGYTYAYFPDTKAMLEARTNLIIYYETLNKRWKSAKRTALQEYGAEVERIYAECAKQNGDNNDKRAVWAYNGNRCMVVSLVVFAVCGMAYLGNTVGTPDKPVRIRIDNWSDLHGQQAAKPPAKAAHAEPAAEAGLPSGPLRARPRAAWEATEIARRREASQVRPLPVPCTVRYTPDALRDWRNW